jgi:citronellol/citronellal dehydrogenase
VTLSDAPMVRADRDRSLSGRTLIVSGGSRGIGLAIALRAARDGARIALLAKTETPHPRLHGTIYTAAEAISAAGGVALPIPCDIRDDQKVLAAVERTASEFGGIDICVNNASAIDMTPTEQLPMSKYDLMHDINARGSYFLARACVPHLRKAANPHVLALSPPFRLTPKWLGVHPAYSAAKFVMSMYTVGMAEEFRSDGIAFNSLWPRTLIATDAVRNMLGGEETIKRSRTTDIMSDAAHFILTRLSRECTGNLFWDDEVLAEEGIRDLAGYSVEPGATNLLNDIYVDEV